MTQAFRQGDVVLLDFDPQAGHEQKGRRPAVVVSADLFQRRVGLAVVCPITTTDRGFPLHVPLDERTRTAGFVMCEQLKSLDLASRRATRLERLPPDVLEEVVDIVAGFFAIPEG